MIGSPADRKMVEPARAVIEPPEGHTIDLVTMTEKHGEEFSVPLRELLLHFCGQTVGIRIERWVGLFATGNIRIPHIAARGQHIDVKLGNHYLQPQCREVLIVCSTVAADG